LEEDSTQNTVIGNNCTGNMHGIYVSYSNDNKLINNTLSNGWWGIIIKRSETSNLTGNVMIKDGIFLDSPLLDELNQHEIDTSNTLDGKPVYYWKNRNGGTIPAGAGQVIIVNCQNINIENQTLTFGAIGIHLGFSSNINIFNNNVSNNIYGIYIWSSDGNYITDNTFSSNTQEGILIGKSVGNTISRNSVSFNGGLGISIDIIGKNNLIYHNDFIGNADQASDVSSQGNQWDNGYPSGGNYWSDYSGADGDGDGIGDTPYVIDSNSQDNYPLMKSFKNFIAERPVHNLDKDSYHIRIQDAIDEADPGNSIFAKNGTYYENVVIDKSLTLTGEDRNTTTIEGDGNEDVVFVGADWVTISGFTITGTGMYSGDAAIQVDSDYGNIYNNIIPNNTWGIFLHDSAGHNVANNIVINNTLGIYLSSANGCSVAGNSMIEDGIAFQGTLLEHWNTHAIDTTNTVNGKPVYYWKNRNGGTVPSGAGQVILANCQNIDIENQELAHGCIGVQLGFSSSNYINSNNVTYNWGGIILAYSNDNFMVENNVKNNIRGMGIGSSSGNYIINNTASANDWEGILLVGADGNNITGNTVTDNNDYGIVFVGSDGNTIAYNAISSNFEYGISLDSSNGNTVTNNSVSLNFNYGIQCTGSDNIIINNTVSLNNYGIYLALATNNRIHHNSIIDNAIQAYDNRDSNYWDDDYPSGGNFWSDYSGDDYYNGPDQNVPGSDGIGDINYSIDPDSVDRYPLMVQPDIYAPTIQLLFPENNSVIQEGVILDFQVNDDALYHANYSINDGSPNPLPNPYDIPTVGLFDGGYVIHISALDLAGNSNTSWFYFIIDSSQPMIHLDFPDNNSVVQNGTVLEFSITDQNPIQANYSVNGEPAVSFSDPFEIATEGWDDREHTVQINVVDVAGNRNSSCYFFTIDSTKPIIELNSPENNSYIPNGTLLDFTVSDSHLLLANYSINPGDEFLLSDPFDISTAGWPDDNYTIHIKARDVAGNFNSVSFSFTLDSTNPVIILCSPHNNSCIPDGVFLNFTVSDAHLPLVNHSIDGGDEALLSPPFNISTDGWKDGNYKILINATDLAGNTLSAWFFLTIDSTPPLITLNEPENNALIRAGTSLDFKIEDANPWNVTYSIDDGPSYNLSKPYDITTGDWPDGGYVVKIETIDLALNVNATVFFFTIDSTEPEIHLNSPENNRVIKAGTILNFIISDLHLMEVKYSINNTPKLPLQEPYDLFTDDWSEGNYSILIESRDLAGNSFSSWFFFIIDNTPPFLSFDSNLNHTILSAGQTIQIYAPDPDVEEVMFSLDEGEYMLLEPPYILYPYTWTEGSHIVHIRAKDGAGNEAVLWFEIKVDTDSPYIIYCDPPQNSRDVDNDTTITIAFSEAMNGADVGRYLHISPEIEYSFQWNEEGTVLTISFAPEKLADGATYKVTIDGDLADKNGNKLGSDFELVFTTYSEPIESEPPLDDPPIPYWAVFAILGVIALLIVVMFLLGKKRGGGTVDWDQ
ncbi:MAG: right-handed parallel beta-helix repeat-containing protein, partial [Thermoplasmata archaeon]